MTRQQVSLPPLGKKQKKVLLWIVGIIVLLWIIFALASQISANAQSRGSIKSKLQAVRGSIKSKLQAVTDVAEARELIDGTVWHYTKNLSDPDDQIGFWMKVEFHGNTYTHYRADPNDGEWEKVNEGTYEIVENRYSDTGRKYIAVEWDGSETLLPLKLSLSLKTFIFAATTRELSLPSPNWYENLYRIPKPAQTRYGVMELGDYEWD